MTVTAGVITWDDRKACRLPAQWPLVLPVQTTWDSTTTSGNFTLSLGNSVATALGSTLHSVRALHSRAAGKWYFEFIPQANAAKSIVVGLGLTGLSVNDFPGDTADSWGLDMAMGVDSALFNNGVSSVTGVAFSSGEICGVAVDLDAGKMWFAKNNVWITGDPAAGSSPSFTGVSGTLFIWGTAVDQSLSKCVLPVLRTYTEPDGFRNWY